MSLTLNHALGPVTKYLDPNKYIEVKANRFEQLHLETMEGAWRTVSVPELTAQKWEHIGLALSKATGQRFDERLPSIKGILPGGHRLFMIMGGNVVDPDSGGPGIAVAIRVRSNRNFSLEDFGLDDVGKEIVDMAIEDRLTIAIAGGTGSGKTSLARTVIGKIKDAAPVSVEDTPEIDLGQKVASSLILSPDAADTELTHKHILDGMIKIRPDRPIIGELTVDNCRMLMRLLNIGNDGAIFTVHADSAEDTVASIAEMFAVANYNSAASQEYMRRKIGLIIYCKKAGGKRLVTKLFRPDPTSGDQVLWTPS